MKSIYFPQHGGVNTEQSLIQSLVDEQIRLFGSDVYYLPRKMIKDVALNDVLYSEFTTQYMIEMLLINVEGFGSPSEFISKFGLRITDEITMVVSQNRWSQVFQEFADVTTVDGRPNEGDIVFVPLLKSYFEIQFVEDQEPFYQLGNLPVYKLKVTRWEYSSEEINTGNEVLDQTEDKYSLNELAHRFTLEYGQEALTGRGSIVLEDYHDYSTGQPAFLMNETYTGAEVVATQSPYAQNLDMNTEAGYDTVGDLSDDILDFTERNPFGEIDE